MEIVKFSLISGVNPNNCNLKDMLTIHIAAYGVFTEVVKLLLQYSTDSYFVDDDKFTPLHYVAWRGHLDNCYI